MNLSAAGLALIKEFEGCQLVAYRDPRGILTIGVGHTGPDVHEGLRITQAMADSLLRQDLAIFCAAVDRLTHDVPTTQHQFDAMVCLAFNIGASAFAASTVLARHRVGKYDEAADAFLKWTRAGGKRLPGLVRRRTAERDLYMRVT